MKCSINIATYPSREECLSKMLKSVRNQFDIVRVYVNQFEDYELHLDDIIELGATDVFFGVDYTDNGKFFGLASMDFDKASFDIPPTFPSEHEYYFTADDDLSYPSTYCSDMVQQIEKHKCIITHHGRIIRGLDRDYYRQNQMFSCLSMQNSIREIDVAGTGVTAFSTEYFHPKNLINSEFKKMSDLIFSLEAAEQGKTIMVVNHTNTYFKYLKPELNGGSTIHRDSRKGKDGINKQNMLANKIYKILRA